MKTLLDRYLDRVLVYANLPDSQAGAVRQELADHLIQKIEDLRASGLAREDATLEALRRHGSPQRIGYGLRGGFPWLDVRTKGTARGVIAVGPKAVGIFAFGGAAFGVVAFGGISAGLISMGGLCAGLLLAQGGFAVGSIAYGGFALGLVAMGGLAVGAIVDGGQTIGWWDPGHALNATMPPTVKFLARLTLIPRILDRYYMIMFLVNAVFAVGMVIFQGREGQRTRSESDWIVEGD